MTQAVGVADGGGSAFASRLRVLAWLVVLAMLSGLAVVSGAAPAAAAEPPAATDETAEALSVSGEPVPGRSAPGFDASEESARARASGERVEVTELRTETSATFATPQGQLQTEVSLRPVHFRDPAGAWQPVDARLVPADGGGWQVAAAAFSAHLPASLGTGPVRLAEGDTWVELRLDGAAATAGVVDGNTVTYPDVFPGVDVQFAATGAGLQKLITLADASARSEFTFAVTASPDTTLTASRTGVSVRRPGSAGFVVPLPWAADGSTDLQAGGGSRHVRLSAARTSTGWTLGVALNRGWLTAPGRVFPVVLDPTLVRQDSTLRDCFIYVPQPADVTYCGYDRIDVGGYWDIIRRGLLQFDLTSIPTDSTVTDMSLDAWTLAGNVPDGSSADIAVHRMRSAWSPTTVAWQCRDQWETYDGCNPWPAGGDVDLAGLSTTSVPATAGANVWWFGLAGLAQQWVRDPGSNFGLMLRAVNEPNTAIYKLASTEHPTQPAPRAIVTWVPRTGEQAFETVFRQRLTDRSDVAVNVANGNLIVRATDLVVPGTGLDLTVGRTYNSLAAFRGVRGPAEGNGALSPGWSSGTLADTALYVLPSYKRATFYGPDGRVVPFTLNTDGTWKAPPAQNATLRPAGPGSYQLTFHDSNLSFFFSQGVLDEYVLNRIVDRNGNQISYSFVGGSGLIGSPGSVTDTQNRTFTLGYTTAGGQKRLASVTDPTGRQQTYGYDSTGRLVSVHNGEPTVGPTVYGYTNGMLTSITDPEGRQTLIGYDTGTGRVSTLTRVTDPAASPPTGHTTTFGYPSATTSTVTDARGHTTTYLLDADRRVEQVTDPLGHVRNREYTPNSAVASFTGAATGAVTYTYGANNGESLTGRKIATGAQDIFSYANPPGAAGRQYLPSAVRNPRQTSLTETRLSYDAAGNLAQSVTNGEAGKVAVNPDGTVKSSTTPNNVGTTSGRTGCASTNTSLPGASTAADNCSTVNYTYTASGSLSSRTVTPPVGAKWLRPSTTRYDTLGRVLTLQDGRGVTTSYSYDGLDRVKTVSYSDGTPTVIFSYDGSGNTRTRTDGTGTTTVDYDPLNRPFRRTVPNRPVLTYGYDPVGNMTSSVEGSATTTYVYGPTNMLDQVTEPDGAVTTFDYDDDDRRTKTTYPASTAVQQVVGYDNAGRVKTVTTKKGSTVLVSLEYCYAKNSSTSCSTAAADDRDQLQWRKDHVTGKRTTYGYDGSDRLKTAADGTTTYSYNYDKNGNRSSDSVTGALSEANAYAHDVADMLCSRRAGVTSGANCIDSTNTSTTTIFTHDAAGNMTAAGTTTAAYNGAHQTTRYGVETFSYAGTGQADRLTAGNTEFTNGLLGTQREDTSGATTDFSSAPDGQLISITIGGGKHYYLFDGQGSVIGLVDTNGTRSATYTYDPYGAHHTEAGSAAVGNPFRYISGYRDNNTGLYKLGIRYYNPELGRFTQLDPTGQSAHYTYANNNPVNRSDPSGAFDISALADELRGVSVGLGLVALVANPASLAVALGALSAVVGVAAEAADDSPCRAQRIAFNAVLSSLGGSLAGAFEAGGLLGLAKLAELGGISAGFLEVKC